MSYKAIVFDYDDTLVQTKLSKWDALRETGKRFYNLNISDEHIKKYWGKPYLEMLQGVLMHADTIDNLRENYEKTTIEYPMQAHKDAVEVIKSLLSSYEVGIVTASARKLVVDDLKQLGFPIDKLFYIQTSEDTSMHKPNPAVFEPILKRLRDKNIFKEELLYCMLEIQ